MRKMRKYRFLGLAFFLILHFLNKAKAQGIFEDADKLSDLMSSNSEQHFDLRHTIPGVPEVDYPIYSHVPKTSFECTGRHEGYYADMESRCQAFRICTHTARSAQGFGFLCPNGTLFSQKHFVCDWYRNVNCDDSERFFSKNDVNRIGSSFDMMETVRQMMEYPMKTISKALQQNTGSIRNPVQRHRGANKGTQASIGTSKETETVKTRGRSGSTRKSVTRDQVESAHNRGSTKFGSEKNTAISTEKEEIAEDDKNFSNVENSSETDVQFEIASNTQITDDVYVNSLGELSTDAGVTFDRTNAHIIAEPRPYRYEKNKMNFAERVNAGLNDFIDLPANESLAPDYVKSLRDSNNGNNEPSKIDLPSNINGLLDEIANDLNPSSAGYQLKKPIKAKHSFRFLSRGFSSQDDTYKYKKPKQTASTIQFTPNQLPIEEKKTPTKPALEIAHDAVPFGHSTIAPEIATASPLLGESTDYLLPPPELPAFAEAPYLSPPALESTDDAVTSAPIEQAITATNPPSATEVEQEIFSVTSESPNFAPLIDTTTTLASTEVSNIETSTAVPDITQNLIATAQQEQKTNIVADEIPIDEDRVDVNKQAENLFISGLQLTSNENNTELTTADGTVAQTPLLIQVADDHSYLTAWITSTALPITEAVSPTTTTTPETQTELGSLQERIRNYRRLANLQRATAKPLIYGKRAGLRMNKLTNTTSKSNLKSTSTTTTLRPTLTTRSYLKRIAASRLRLSRLGNKQNQATTESTGLSPVDNAIDASSGKKLSIRNIDRETGNVGNSIAESAATKNSGVVTWESVKNSLQRFQVNRKGGRDSNNNVETPNGSKIAATSNSSTTTRSTLTRKRNRVSNFKSQQPKGNENGANNFESTTSKSTSVSSSISMSVSSSSSSSSTSYSRPSSLSFLNSISHLAPSTISTQPALSLTSNQVAQNNIAKSTFPSDSFINGATADNTNLNSNSASDPKTFISFDKLTRSIVDDSILQNYRGGQILGRSSLEKSSAPLRNAFSPVTSSQPVHSTFTQDIAASYNKLPVTSPFQPEPIQRLAQLSTFPATVVPTTAGPRIVVARAEGQRVEPNNVPSIISSLIAQQKAQPKSTPVTSYVPLNDFISKKFGNQLTNKIPLPTTSNYNTQSQQYQQQPYNQPQAQQITQRQQQQSQQNRQQQQYNQQQTQQITQRQQQYQQTETQQQQHQQQADAQQHQQIRQQQFYQNQPQYQAKQQQQQEPNNYYSSTAFNSLQQSTAQNNYLQKNQPQSLFNQQSATPSILQPLITQNIFGEFKQQQQQLPVFPPLATPSQQSSQLLQFDGNNNYLNVKLPSLPNGLIPAPTNQIAQKRNDIAINELELTNFTPMKSVFTGATSYDVPLSSIGRLPNDMQALLRRLRKY